MRVVRSVETQYIASWKENMESQQTTNPREQMLATLSQVEQMTAEQKGKVVAELIGSLPQEVGAKIMAQSLESMRTAGKITAQDLLVLLRNFFANAEIGESL